MRCNEHPFIQSIPENRRAQLLEEVEILAFEPGQSIFTEMSEPDAMFLILEGVVSFGKSREDSGRQLVSRSIEGEFFGEVGVFTGDFRALDAQADTPCVIARLPEALVSKIIRDAAPMRKILESTISHLSSTTNHYMTDLMRTEKLSLVGTMMASILHDFRNPFSIISLSAHVVGQRHPEDEKTLQVCKSIESQIRRMVDMANDLSAFARGDEAIKLKEITVKELLNSFQDLNEPFFSDPGIPIEMDLCDVSLQVDVGKLHRVLQNIISNAREAIESTETIGKISISCHQTDESAVLKISDTGPGIPPEIHDRFFEPFVTSGKVNGTGLGSAIAYSNIQAHKGSITFTSRPGETIFTITIPLSQETED